MAASAVGAGMGRAAGDAMAASGSIKAAFSSWGDTYGQIARASVSGFAAGMTANIVRGGTQTVIQVATDAFGNALGGSMAELLDAEGVQEHALRLREDARDAAMHRIVTGGGGTALWQAGNAMPDGTRKWLSRSTAVPDAQAQQTMRDGAARIRGMQAYGQGVQLASAGAALPGEVVSDAGAGAGSAPEPEVSWDKYADDVDNYDLMGNAPQVGVAGRQARQGAWGIAKSLAGPGASNAEINRIKNQLLTLNPELAGGVKAGQRYYVPGPDAAENVALARQADGAYARMLSDRAARNNNANYGHEGRNVPAPVASGGAAYYAGADGLSPEFGGYTGQGAVADAGGGTRFLQRLGGAIEIGVSGIYNGGVKIVGGLASIPALVNGVDAAVAVQQRVQDAAGRSPSTDGARLLAQDLAPVGQALSTASNQLRAVSERYLGDGLTTTLAVGAQVGLESLGLVAGVRGAQALLEGIVGGATGSVPRAVIGRMDDLRVSDALRAGEYTIADKLPNLGDPKANYYQNMSVLREEMRRGVPIRDASNFRPDTELAPKPDWPTRTIRQTFTGAERNQLRNREWTFDGEYWNPPR